MSYGAIQLIASSLRFRVLDPGFVPHDSLQQEALSSIAILVQRSVAVAVLVSVCICQQSWHPVSRPYNSQALQLIAIMLPLSMNRMDHNSPVFMQQFPCISLTTQ